MKIGVSSYSFSRYMRETGANYFKICDHAKEIGFDGVFSLETLPSAKLPDSLFLEGAAHLAHIVDEILA